MADPFTDGKTEDPFGSAQTEDPFSGSQFGEDPFSTAPGKGVEIYSFQFYHSKKDSVLKTSDYFSYHEQYNSI